MSQLHLTPDQLLTTTRAVRKRLDLTRPVEIDVLRECIEIATQAPTGGNRQHWSFVIVTDAEKKQRIAELYRQSFQAYIVQVAQAAKDAPAPTPEQLETMERVRESSMYLAEHMHEVPVLVIPCMEGRVEGASVDRQAGAWGSILPAVWSFMLAARERALGTVWTTLHLVYEKEAAEILGIPYEKVTQTSLIPVAYTLGTDFKPGPRKALDKVIHVNGW